MTAAARGVVGVRLVDDASMGSALADDAMAFNAACTMAADANELLLLAFSALPAQTVARHHSQTRAQSKLVFTAKDSHEVTVSVKSSSHESLC